MRITRYLLLTANVIAPVWWLTADFCLLAAAVMGLVHMLTLWATLWPSCRWWGDVLCQFETDKPEVWITIDDGPDGGHTRATMDLLEEKEARATFFFIAERCQSEPGIVRQVIHRGHGVGNHTCCHPAYTFWSLGPRRLREEIGGCSTQIEQLTGVAPVLFRAPVGMRNCFVHPILRRLGLKLVAWSTRGFDGSRDDVERVVSRIARRIKPGAIILLHEGRRTGGGGSLIAKTLPKVLEIIESRELKAVIPTISQLRRNTRR
ncbi:MAG: polysaccharide deacetylase family protein [Verrucomicrobiales bacterium]